MLSLIFKALFFFSLVIYKFFGSFWDHLLV
jgi:hypothetical protein